MHWRLTAAVFLISLFFGRPAPAAGEPYDIVIYGGTSAGISAAVQGARMGKTVVLIEPTRHLGGLTTGGLGATDIGNKRAIGGIAREFYGRIWQHYSDPAAWTREMREAYFKSRGGYKAQDITHGGH